jgi:hypothetical protein
MKKADGEEQTFSQQETVILQNENAFQTMLKEELQQPSMTDDRH